MNIKMYKKTGLFFTLSTALPWSLWFIAAYISHAEQGSNYLANLSSVVAFLGLLAPIGVTGYLAKDNPELLTDLLRRFFNLKESRSDISY